MAQQAIELILMRQLASYLATPVFLVDPGGTLLYYNEPAEDILGEHFDEAGPMPVDRWATIFTPVDDEGRELEPDALPLVRALTEGRPAHGRFWIEGLDRVRRHIEVTAFPLLGVAGRFVGAVAIFWEAPPE
jgi:PAS domain-containing protein